MAKQANERPEVKCPVYELLEKLCGKRRGSGEFLEHLKNAHVEVLLAVRSLIDERVAHIRREGPAGGRSRRIKVTEKA